MRKNEKQCYNYLFKCIENVQNKYPNDTDVQHLMYAFCKLTTVDLPYYPDPITDTQSDAINNTKEYSIDNRHLEFSDELEIAAELKIFNKTQFYASKDLGGITVYIDKAMKLLAFYDYEMQCGTVFDEAVV